VIGVGVAWSGSSHGRDHRGSVRARSFVRGRLPFREQAQ
jgi:hypothetical protein